MKLLIAALSIGVISAGMVAHGQSISDELKQRTGAGLPDARSERPVAFTLPPGATLIEQLSVQDAVSIALWNNSALLADLAGLDVSRADVVEAGLFRNPSFSMLLPVGPKPFEFLLTWPIEEWLQRRQRIKAAKLNVEASATGLVQNGLNLVRDVRVAHTDLWLAQERGRTLHESAELRERIRNLTEKRKANGDATGLDVSLSRADARSASELAGNARDEITIVRSRLGHLLGMGSDNRKFSAILDPATPPLPELTSLLETATSNRPDLRAAELTIQRNAELAKWERSRILAMLAPALSTKGVGSAGIRTGPGLNMEIPILSRNQGQISRADAEVVRAGRVYASLKDQVEQEVIDARERMLQAQTSLSVLREQVLPTFDESIRLTERAYQNGDVSLLNVLEANRQRFDAALREIEAVAAVHRALADLERAIGRSL